jgi:hypothetical protein
METILCSISCSYISLVRMNSDEYSRRCGQAAKTAVACCVARGGPQPGLSTHPILLYQSKIVAGLAGSRKAHAPIIIAPSWAPRPLRLETAHTVHREPCPRHLPPPPLTSRRRRRKDSAPAPAAFALAAAFSGGLSTCGRETPRLPSCLPGRGGGGGGGLGLVRRVRAMTPLCWVISRFPCIPYFHLHVYMLPTAGHLEFGVAVFLLPIGGVFFFSFYLDGALAGGQSDTTPTTLVHDFCET